MRALLLSEYGRLDVVDVPMPRPGEEEILIRVEACGICGSDVHGYDGTSGRRIPPLIMGHEAAGTIAAVGAHVKRLHIGERVTFDSTVYCGKCAYCLRGEVNLCDHRQVLGVSTPDFRREGAFAEYVVVPQHIVYPVPGEMAFEHAAMIEPLAVAVHAVALSKVDGATVALVLGAGMIGLLVVQALRQAGCKQVFVVDLDETRLGLATELGATHTINAKTQDARAEIERLTGGKGVDVALEAVGSTPTVRTAIESVRKGGRVTLIGNVVPTVEIPLQIVVSRELTLQGTAASAGEYPRCIEMVAKGEINLTPLITAIAGLEDGSEWFERLHKREPNLMKIVLKPRAQA